MTPIPRGESVLITSVRNCIYGFNDNMEALIGREAIVKLNWFHSDKGANAYRLDVDNGTYIWCDNCIEPVRDINESDADVLLLLT